MMWSSILTIFRHRKQNRSIARSIPPPAEGKRKKSSSAGNWHKERICFLLRNSTNPVGRSTSWLLLREILIGEGGRNFGVDGTLIVEQDVHLMHPLSFLYPPDLRTNSSQIGPGRSVFARNRRSSSTFPCAATGISFSAENFITFA